MSGLTLKGRIMARGEYRRDLARLLLSIWAAAANGARGHERSRRVPRHEFPQCPRNQTSAAVPTSDQLNSDDVGARKDRIGEKFDGAARQSQLNKNVRHPGIFVSGRIFTRAVRPAGCNIIRIFFFLGGGRAMSRSVGGWGLLCVPTAILNSSIIVAPHEHFEDYHRSGCDTWTVARRDRRYPRMRQLLPRRRPSG